MNEKELVEGILETQKELLIDDYETLDGVVRNIVRIINGNAELFENINTRISYLDNYEVDTEPYINSSLLDFFQKMLDAVGEYGSH